MRFSKILWPQLLIFLFLVFVFPSLVFSQVSVSELITATIKISVCGNLIAEGGEDCDNLDLKGETCLSLGYAGGDLTCDIACEFDTSSCVVPTPTLTPTPTTATTSTTTTETATEITPTPTSLPGVDLEVETEAVPALLPPVVALFDLDASGRIEVTEILGAVSIWVEKWREVLVRVIAGEEEPAKGARCDLNDDSRCDLYDFSILMYYIGK